MPIHGKDIILNNPAFIHPTAQIYGKATIQEGASIWTYVVIRAEMHFIEIGSFTNIQDFAMIHIGPLSPTQIGSYCTVGHHAVIQSAKIGDNCLIGVNATVMDGCKIGDNSIIEAGTLLETDTIIPPNSIVKGNPGRVVETKPNNWMHNRFNAMNYLNNAKAYNENNYRLWSDPEYQERIAGELIKLRREFKNQ